MRATAALTDDLLIEGFEYVLFVRFQSDPIERRFSVYRQKSGGRFLVSLREVVNSEKTILLTSLLKENIYINNNQKNSNSEVRKDDVRRFKARQTEKRQVL